MCGFNLEGCGGYQTCKYNGRVAHCGIDIRPDPMEIGLDVVYAVVPGEVVYSKDWIVLVQTTELEPGRTHIIQYAHVDIDPSLPKVIDTLPHRIGTISQSDPGNGGVYHLDFTVIEISGDLNAYVDPIKYLLPT